MTAENTPLEIQKPAPYEHRLALLYFISAITGNGITLEKEKNKNGRFECIVQCAKIILSGGAAKQVRTNHTRRIERL